MNEDYGIRISKLEVCMENVEETLENIRDNHLHTIDQKLDDISENLTSVKSNTEWHSYIIKAVFVGLVLATLGGLITSFVN